MTDRPDYVRCIADPEHTKRALCGRPAPGWMFVDGGHARANAESDEPPAACGACKRLADTGERRFRLRNAQRDIMLYT